MILALCSVLGAHGGVSNWWAKKNDPDRHSDIYPGNKCMFSIGATYHQWILLGVKHYLPYERPGNIDFLIIVKLHLIHPRNLGEAESPCEAVLI